MPRSRYAAVRALIAAAALGGAAPGQEAALPWDVPEVFLGADDEPATGVVDADGDLYADLICDDAAASPTTLTRRLAVRTGGVWQRVPAALSWQTVEPISGANPAQWALPADADDDGDQDLFFAAGSAVRIFLLPATQATFASWPPDFDAGMQIEAAAVADVTGDGSADVLYYAGNELVFLWRVASTWYPQRLPFFAQGTPRIFVGETDGDPESEFLLCDDVRVWQVQASVGLLSAQSPFAHECARPRPVSGDVDGDGDRDFVVFDDADYVLFRRAGAVSFVAEAKTSGGPATHLVDVDLDGDLDGVSCGDDASATPPYHAPSPFRVAENLGDGTFALAVEFMGLGAQQLAGAVDLDQDGDIDLVGGRARLFARGALLPRAIRTSELPDERLPVPSDVDDDGDLDVEGHGPGEIWLSSGDGRYSFADRRALSVRVHDLRGPACWLDIDGDGDRDQVVQQFIGGTFAASICLVNRGGWFFDGGPCAPAGIAVGGSLPEYAGGLARDLDGDGDLDLIACARTVYACELWRNSGGQLQPWTTLGSEVVVEVADFDGDLLPDLLVSDGGLALRLGSANGTFTAASPLVPAQPQLFRSAAPSFDPWQDELAILDLGTGGPAGLLDIVAIHRNDPAYPSAPYDHVIALVNQGGGAFSPAAEAPAFGMLDPGCDGANATRGRRVRALDCNGDATLDLAFAPVGRDAESWQLVLRDPAQGSALEGPEVLMRAERFADADGDGDVDGFGARLDLGSRWFGARAGSRVQFGIPSEGSDGTWPVIGTGEPQRTGHSDRLRLRGAIGGAPAGVFLGTQRTQIYLGPGLYFAIADPVLAWAGFLGGTPGEPGAGSLDLVFPPLPRYFAGLRFGVQVLVLDGGALSGVSATPGLWKEKGW